MHTSNGSIASCYLSENWLDVRHDNIQDGCVRDSVILWLLYRYFLPLTGQVKDWCHHCLESKKVELGWQ